MLPGGRHANDCEPDRYLVNFPIDSLEKFSRMQCAKWQNGKMRLRMTSTCRNDFSIRRNCYDEFSAPTLHDFFRFISLLPASMTDQLLHYRKYARGIRNLLLFAGLWPSEKWQENFVYRRLSIFNGFICFSTSFVVLNFCLHHSTNLDLVTKAIGIMGSYLSAVLKVICFLVNRKELVELHRTLEKHFQEILDNPQLRVTVFESLSIFVNPSVTITILVFTGTLVFFLTPLIVLVVQYSNDVYPLKFILPYPGKYPWKIEGGSLVYYLHYSWEILAGSYLFCVTSGVDSLFGYYVFQMHAILRTMSLRMRNLGSADGDCYGTIIRDCVCKHRMLAQCRDNLQKIYGPIVLWMFLTSAIIMCTLIFQASETREMTVGYAILFTVYISMKLLQALMYAWYGGILSIESQDFREAVYASGWPGSGNKSLMNNILIMMYPRPLVLTACKLLIISTDMFTAILNATMSYFFLLQTLDDGN